MIVFSLFFQFFYILFRFVLLNVAELPVRGGIVANGGWLPGLISSLKRSKAKILSQGWHCFRFYCVALIQLRNFSSISCLSLKKLIDVQLDQVLLSVSRNNSCTSVLNLTLSKSTYKAPSVGRTELDVLYKY